MLKLFYTATNPSLRILFLLEELNLNYKKLPINVFKKQTLNEEYTKVVPSQKTPALVMEDGKVLFDSANILLFLAQKHNKLLPADGLSWFFWGASELNPKFMNHITEFAGGNTNIDMMESIQNQLKDLLVILDNRLANNNFLDGAEFSISDINVYTMIKYYTLMNIIPNLIADFSNIQEWMAKIDTKPSAQKMLELIADFDKEAETTNEEIIAFLNS